MTRLVRQIIAATMAIILAGTVVTALGWVVATTEGAGWLLKSVASWSGVSFTFQKIEGNLHDHLRLSGGRIGLLHQKLEFDSAELRWKPLLLLGGNVAVQELSLNGVRIQDDTPPDNKAPDLTWPEFSKQAHLFDVTVMRLQINGLSYRRLQEQPLLVTALGASLGWQNDQLAISNLTLVSPSGLLQGTVVAGFTQPSLTTDLELAVTEPIQGMTRFVLQTRPGSVTAKEPFAGSFTVVGSTGSRNVLQVGGELGMLRNSINLRQLRMTMPEQRGVLTAEGSLLFTAQETLLSLQLKGSGVNLAPYLDLPTDISGKLNFAGNLERYRGTFTMANQAHGWQAAAVTASYQGTRSGMKLSPFRASIIDGALEGDLEMDWRNGFALKGSLNARNLNPARLDPAWSGIANFKASGNLAWSEHEPLQGNLSATLLESRLHGQALTGSLQADFSGNDISLSRLALQGKGFEFDASGKLDQRITMVARISDFSRLVPGTSGTLQGNGWVRWHAGQLSGVVAGSGSRLAYAGTSVAGANLNVRLDQGPGYPLQLSTSLREVNYDGYQLDSMTLALDGTLLRHTLKATLRSGGLEARVGVLAGYRSAVWRGELVTLAGKDGNGLWTLVAPATFAVSSDSFTLSPLVLAASATEHLQVSLNLKLKSLEGEVRSGWSGLNLARGNPYLKQMQLSGTSSGTLQVDVYPDKHLALKGSIAANGSFKGEQGSMTIKRSLLTFDGNQTGTRFGFDLAMVDGGSLKGNFTSVAPLRLAWPEKGELTAEYSGIDLALFKTWLPSDTVLAGLCSGRVQGKLRAGNRFDLGGSVALSGGTVHQRRPEGELKLAVTAATASWEWRESALATTIALTTAEYGQMRGSFRLPLAARFPLALNRKGTVQGSLTGQFHETGIITALFPGFVQESSGEIEAELTANGTWETAHIAGKLRLTKAGAYLPTAGIYLKDVQLAARLEKNLIRIESFRARSGRGHIEGTALITLAGWQIVSYQGSMTGDNFQTVNFPELQMLCSPKLTFEGTLQKLTMRGELLLPELNIVGAQTRSIITSSSDVIREGVVLPVAPPVALELDIQLRVRLGDKVFVKVSGIDAQLSGGMELSLTSLDNITSTGEIKVIKGRFRTYGVNLDIVRGRLFFAGGAVNRPSLDFLALRTIGNVRAGVTVVGTLQKPVTKLYSEPVMPDVMILSYIILGHSLDSSGEQGSLLTQAAGVLLSSSQAVLVQEQIKNYLGLNTLEIQGGVAGSSSAMGYKPLQVTTPGALPETQQPGITETVLTVGKYLTPQLYISYGKSLFTGSNLFRLRYDIFKHWQIETQTGSGESGADLYYKLEFK